MGLLPVPGSVWQSISVVAESVAATSLDSGMRLVGTPNHFSIDPPEGLMSRAFLDKSW